MKNLFNTLFRSYSGHNLLNYIYLVGDLQKMPPSQKVNESQNSLKQHLIRNNVPSNIAQKYVFGEFIGDFDEKH